MVDASLLGGGPYPFQALFVLIGPDEAKVISLRNVCVDPVFDLCVNDQALRQFLTDILFTLRTIRQALLYDAWPDRAGLIDQFGVF